MRRSLEEGVTGRFVTPERLLAILKVRGVISPAKFQKFIELTLFTQGMPNLLAFGGTEYMDGALTTPVLQELLLRGSHSYGRGRPSRGRGLFIVLALP